MMLTKEVNASAAIVYGLYVVNVVYSVVLKNWEVALDWRFVKLIFPVTHSIMYSDQASGTNLDYHSGITPLLPTHQEVLWSGVFVGWLVRSFVTLVVISVRVKVRFPWNLAHTFSISLLTFQRSRSKFKVSIIVLVSICFWENCKLSGQPDWIWGAWSDQQCFPRVEWC